MSSLPYMDQDEFAAACDAFISLFLSTYDADYSLRQSPYNKEQKYLVIRRNTHGKSIVKYPEESTNIVHPEKDEGLSTPIAISTEDSDDDIEELWVSDEDEDASTSLTEAAYDIEYHVVFSPIYKLPVLYFNVYPRLKNTHGGRQAPLTSLDAVYELLVPDYLEEELRRTGVTGGISQGMHPLLDMPFWFVHPCETAAAIRQWGDELSLETYLSLWVGVVGRAVGLEFRLTGLFAQGK